MLQFGRNRGATLLMVIALVISGCALFRTPKATVSVDDITLAFPTIQRLSAVVYSNEAGQDGAADCEYFEYGRGAFTSKPEDEFCRVFDFANRQPGGGSEGPAPAAFDAQARADLAEFLAAFKPVGVPLDYVNLVPTANGSIGPDTNLAFDRCVSYVYQPGWTTLPEDTPGDSVSSGIDKNWYKADGCP
jgi:hypothetical protein